MEFAASLPPSLKIRGQKKKHLLKRGMADLLPREILNRPKQGFAIPLDLWFRRHLKEMAYDILLDPRSLERGYFRPDAVKRLLDEHVRGVGHWHHEVWTPGAGTLASGIHRPVVERGEMKLYLVTGGARFTQ